MLEHPGGGARLSDEARKHIKDSWSTAYGGVDNAGRVALLEEGVKFNQLSVAPNEAQFLESRQFQVTDIARWFGIPPHKLAELSKATFSNIEHQSKEFVDDAVMPWVNAWESEARVKFFGAAEPRLFTKMNLNALLRGDATARSTFYRNLFSAGALSPNQILSFEDMNPIGPEGDEHFVPLNFVTLKNALKTMLKKPGSTTNDKQEGDNAADQ